MGTGLSQNRKSRAVKRPMLEVVHVGAPQRRRGIRESSLGMPAKFYYATTLAAKHRRAVALGLAPTGFTTNVNFDATTMSRRQRREMEEAAAKAQEEAA